MYSTTLDDPNVDGMVLSIPGIRDRGYVQIGSVYDKLLKKKSNSEKGLFIFLHIC